MYGKETQEGLAILPTEKKLLKFQQGLKQLAKVSVL